MRACVRALLYCHIVYSILHRCFKGTLGTKSDGDRFEIYIEIFEKLCSLHRQTSNYINFQFWALLPPAIFIAVFAAVICHLSFDFLGVMKFFCFLLTRIVRAPPLCAYVLSMENTSNRNDSILYLISSYWRRDDAHCVHCLAQPQKVYLIKLIWFFVRHAFFAAFSIKFSDDSVFFLSYIYDVKSHLM